MPRLLSTLVFGALLGLPVALATTLGPGAAVAAPDADAIQRALDDDAGWARQSVRDGVVVYAKPMPALDLTAYKGVKPIDVDPELLFSLICDTEGHMQISDTLADSRVLSVRDDRYDYYQVVKTPAIMPVSDRYWFNRAHIQRDVGGTPGRHKRSWAPLDPGLYPEAHASVTARFPDAVLVAVNYGSWEVVPHAGGQAEVIYRAVTHPGGNVPDSFAAMLAERSLPDNILNFVRAAAERGG